MIRISLLRGKGIKMGAWTVDFGNFDQESILGKWFDHESILGTFQMNNFGSSGSGSSQAGTTPPPPITPATSTTKASKVPWFCNKISRV